MKVYSEKLSPPWTGPPNSGLGFRNRGCLTGRVMLEMVDQCDDNTLLPIIAAMVAPGSIILSDMWLAYNQLE